ncbi:MAG: pyridoxamine 5'-phosphate oxidase family protein [Elusimicrobia bacterium]|nr:pyridoxamine 5'-phosphate oxidase family protein [Elusimicrobiota bacterium]
MAALLIEEETGTLCLASEGVPYGVVVSHAFLDARLVIHCAPEGRKLDFIKANPRACYVVSRHPDKMKPHRAEGKCSYRFESVVCQGRARIVSDAAERLEWLRRFKGYFYEKLGRDPKEDPVGEEAAAHVACIVMDIETMTGRRKA